MKRAWRFIAPIIFNFGSATAKAMIMKFHATMLVSLASILCHARKADLLKYVNPFIGTDKMGHTYIGATVPFGMVQLSPDTDTLPYEVNGGL